MIKKSIFIGLLFINLAVICYFIFFNSTKLADQYLIVNKNYSYLYNEETKIKYPIYFNKINHLFQSKEDIESILLSDGAEINKLAIELDSIYFQSVREYKKTNYFLYQFVLKIPNLQNDLLLTEATLTITNKLSQALIIPLGEFSLRYVEDIGKPAHITIDDLFGITNEFNGSTNLAAIITKINPKNNNIKITDISLASNFVSVDSKELLKLSHGNYANTESIESIIEKSYDFLGEKEEFVPISFNISTYLFLPLKYQRNILVETSYLIITYLYNDNEYVYYLDNFNFFIINNLNLIEGVVQINALD
ncbi:MAG: hypothetical protein FWE36_02795 [Erysipelotrichales bacterium]|nr:hypothetical protein [Erysipelotrichales bacterium]